MGEILYTVLWVGVLVLVVMVGCYIVHVVEKKYPEIMDWSMPDTISG